jgi:hypothetical protein
MLPLLCALSREAPFMVSNVVHQFFHSAVACGPAIQRPGQVFSPLAGAINFWCAFTQVVGRGECGYYSN